MLIQIYIHKLIKITATKICRPSQGYTPYLEKEETTDQSESSKYLMIIK